MIVRSLFLFLAASFASPSFAQVQYASTHDQERAIIMAEREADWRYGPLVYQVIVDRFAPSEDLDAKRDLYPAPKRLRDWSEDPTQGTYNAEAGVWSHEIDFWGGDLDSLNSKLEYVADLGMDVLYLNPIHLAYTNHKYDALDYNEVSPEYGTREDVYELADSLHSKDMKLVMDGVFNHMGRNSPYFKEAQSDPNSPYRDWFVFGDGYDRGYRGWYNVENLPEINLENNELRNLIYGDEDSVIQSYLRNGADGWRLDVAYDIGPVFLSELTRAAHSAKPDSVVIGEIWNYPAEWFPSIDGIMNMTQREFIIEFLHQRISPSQMSNAVNILVEDAGIDNILKSWVMLDNHDTSRLISVFPEGWQQRMAQVLQFTLPGAPCVYYGVEIGLEGGGDPSNRGPMRWEMVTDENDTLNWFKSLVELRKSNRALRIGDYLTMPAENTFAFMRRTERVAETTLVIANPSTEEATEFLPMRESKWMAGRMLKCDLTGQEFRMGSGWIRITVPAQTVYVLRAVIPDGSTTYSTYKRVH